MNSKTELVLADMSIAMQLGREPKDAYPGIAKKYGMTVKQVKDIHQGNYDENLIETLLTTSAEDIRSTSSFLPAKADEMPGGIQKLKKDLDYIAESAEGLQKLRYDVQRVAQKVISRVDELLDDDLDPRGLKALSDSLTAINTSFFKNEGTTVNINNTTNHLAMFRGSLTI